ncbi:hypothetical protein V8B97DRAFT_1920835 [Scleroderma yunnanense]
MRSGSSSITQVLQRIITQVENHLDSNSYKPPQADPPPQQQPSIVIKFPDPPPIIPKLNALGVSRDLSKKLDDLYQEKARIFRERCEANVRSTCLQLSCVPVPGIPTSSSEEKILHAVTDLYLRRMRDWMDTILQLLVPVPNKCLTAAAKSVEPHADKSQMPFNYKYIPLLEHFFDENPFPSHADKVFLARKSGMSFRQIHVWFQNRRSRLKKEGRVLRRKPMSEGATLPLDNLCQRMKNFIATPCTEESLIQRDNTNSAREVKEAECHVFDSVAPPHVFPTKYTGRYLDDAFPVNSNQAKILAPNWYRQPTTLTTRRIQHPVDIDDLVDRFSQLSVRYDSCPRGRKAIARQNDSPATITTMKPPPAPHPALIPIVRPPLVPFQRPHPSKRTTLGIANAFSTWKDDPVTLVPVISRPTLNLSQRKVAPLPKRISHGLLCHNPSSPLSSLASSRLPSVDSPRPYLYEPINPEQSPQAKPLSLPPAILTARQYPVPSPSNAPGALFEAVQQSFVRPTGVQSDLGSYMLGEAIRPYFEHYTPPIQAVVGS